MSKKRNGKDELANKSSKQEVVVDTSKNEVAKATDSVAKETLQNAFSQGMLDKLDDNYSADEEANKISKKNKKLKDKLGNKKIAIVVLVIVLLILLLRSCGIGDKNIGPNIEQSGFVEQEDTHPDHVDGYTAIPVVDDFSVSKSKPYVTLYNPESNAGYSYLQYRFTNLETGEVIYESNLVEPGYKFSVPFGEMLEAGEYNVLVEILNFDYDDYTTRKNGGQSEIIVTVYSE